MTTLIDLIRHGEPVGGVKYRGHTDDPLSELGRSQMWEAVGEAAAWQHIVTSPLLRCARFAAELGERRGIAVSTDARLKEMSFGQWEGCTPRELELVDPTSQRLFYEDPVRYPPPGGEDLGQFSERVLAAWQDAVSTHAGSHVLLVAHGAVIRVVMAHVLGMPLQHLFRLEVGYAAVSRVRIAPGGRATVAFHDGRLV